MLSDIKHWLMSQRPHRHYAWRYTTMSTVLETLIRWFGYAVFTAMLIYMISEKANAVNDAADNRAAAKLNAQAKKIRVLESYLDQCLQLGSHAIFVNDVLYFCGLTNTGIRR